MWGATGKDFILHHLLVVARSQRLIKFTVLPRTWWPWTPKSQTHSRTISSCSAFHPPELLLLFESSWPREGQARWMSRRGKGLTLEQRLTLWGERDKMDTSCLTHICAFGGTWNFPPTCPGSPTLVSASLGRDVFPTTSWYMTLSSATERWRKLIFFLKKNAL